MPGRRIQSKANKVRWELYDLATDPAEASDRFATEGQRFRHYQEKLENWLGSVTRSLNGEDY